MELTAALNTILLPLFLFVIYFMLILFLYAPTEFNYQESVTSTTDSREETDMPVSSIDNVSKEFSLAQFIEGLKKKQLQKLCKPLGIQQSCNKVAKSLQALREEILQKAQENSSQVIAVISDRLPELLPELQAV